MDPAMHTLLPLLTFVVFASLKGVLLITAVLLIQKLAGRYLSAGARYMLWFPVVIALISPVGINLHLPPGLTPATRAAVLAAAVTSADADGSLHSAATRLQSRTPGGEPASADASLASARADTVATDADHVFAWLDLVVCVWLAGVLVVLGAVAGSCHRFFRIVKRATPGPQQLQLLLNACMAQTACRVPVKVLQSAEVQVPMIAGLVKPALLLPAGIELELTRAQLRHVFIHELMHLQRGDIVSNWVVALAQTLHWFNPAVWFAFYCMRQDRELACDAATLRRLVPADRIKYGHTLLQLSDAALRAPVPAIALGILESHSHLQNRISALVQIAGPGKLQSCVAALLLVPLAAAALSQPTPVPAAAPQLIGAESTAIADPAPVPATPVTPVVTPPISVAESSPPPVIAIPVIVEASVQSPARPVTREVPVNQTPPDPPAEPVDQASLVVQSQPANQARPVEQTLAVAAAVRQIESAAVRVPLLAQVDAAPVADAFAPPTRQSTNVIAAVTTTQPQAAAAPGTDIPPVILRMTEAIRALESDQLRVIEEWNGNAEACAARKQDSLFGVMSKPCREVRVVQLRGDVFRFVYACHVLGLQQAAQRTGWRESAAQQQPGMTGVETILLANEQALATLCNTSTYADEYPGYNRMLADAAALKYYNPWSTTPFAANVTPWGPPYVNSAYTSAVNRLSAP